MSMSPKTKPLQSIDLHDLEKVSGGASRVSSRAGGSNEQLTLMLTQITESIKGLASKQGSGSDPMQMMLMMMMMGGLGGGGGGAAPAAAPATAPQPPPLPVINVTVKRNC